MEVIEQKGLLINAKDPARITNTITQSKNLGEVADGIWQVLVKWSLKNAQKLRELKYKNVPSPIRRDYNWPGFYKPFNHQIETAEFLTLHKRGFCFNEQGTGKTGSAIWAADYLMSQGMVRRVLVICPLSIMQSAWQAELFRLTMHRSVGVAHGQPDKRKKVIAGDYEFVIINYDGVEIVQKEIIDGGFDLIIVDEANAYKSTTTKRYKVFQQIIARLNPYLWLMTGTPAAQSPVDAYGLAKLVNPDGVPKFFGSFRDLVMYKVGMFRYVPRPQAERVVHRVLQPAIRFNKAQCLDLPEVTYQNREVELTAQQIKYYKLLKRQMTMQAAGEEITAVNAAVLMNKLLQISAGAAYTDNKETIEFDASNRLNVLSEIVDEASNKVLVFANFTHSIDQIHAHLKSQGHSAAVIDGRTSASGRHELIQKFQTEVEPRILIIQPQAAAHGVTLTAADTIVWFSPVTSLELYLQAIARIDRQGQKNKMTVFHLAGSEVEKKIYKMLQDRQNVHTKILDLYREELA